MTDVDGTVPRDAASAMDVSSGDARTSETERDGIQMRAPVGVSTGPRSHASIDFCPPIEASARVNRGTARHDRWTRPEIRECSYEDFMLDLMRFHHARGRDWELCWSNIDRVLARTGAPFDCLHFYRLMCSLGGFGGSRESAKARIRMTELFTCLFNHYENHTMTDVGNRLLTVYEQYFLEYEMANEEDVSGGTCRACGGGVYHGEPTGSGLLHVCMFCRHQYHRGCQPPYRFHESFGTGKDAGCSQMFCCQACFSKADISMCTAIERLQAKQQEDALHYYQRLYECVARRGRKYKDSYVLPTRKEDGDASNLKQPEDDNDADADKPVREDVDAERPQLKVTYVLPTRKEDADASDLKLPEDDNDVDTGKPAGEDMDVEKPAGEDMDV